MRAGLWCEFVPYHVLRSPPVLRLLRERELEVMVAVTPDRAADVSDVVKACHDAAVRVGLWPMLAHAEGRWPNVHNAEAFAAFVHRLLETCERPDELAIDLEPPIHEFRALLALEAAIIAHMVRRRGVKRGTAKLRELLQQLNGMPTTAAFVPMVLADRQEHGWQRFLGTPVAGLDFTRLSPMLYTSLFEGYARGLLRRREALALLDAGARAALQRYGARAGVSLGVIGSGILGDEPTYRDVSELAQDVSIARAAGVDDILVYSLDGVLARPPAEAWLDAIVDPPAAPRPLPSLRARVVLAAILSVSRALSSASTVGRLIRG